MPIPVSLTVTRIRIEFLPTVIAMLDNAQNHLAMLGELDRVRQQIDQNLREVQLIAYQIVRHLGIDMNG